MNIALYCIRKMWRVQDTAGRSTIGQTCLCSNAVLKLYSDAVKVTSVIVFTKAEKCAEFRKLKWRTWHVKQALYGVAMRNESEDIKLLMHFKWSTIKSLKCEQDAKFIKDKLPTIKYSNFHCITNALTLMHNRKISKIKIFLCRLSKAVSCTL